MDNTAIFSPVRREFPKHTWDAFVTEPPSIMHGGRVVVVPRCSHCRKPLQTVGQFADHLMNDVMPKILETASE